MLEKLPTPCTHKPEGARGTTQNAHTACMRSWVQSWVAGRGRDGGRGNLCLYLTYFFCHFILFKIKSHVALAGPMQMQQTAVSIKCESFLCFLVYLKYFIFQWTPKLTILEWQKLASFFLCLAEQNPINNQVPNSR